MHTHAKMYETQLDATQSLPPQCPPRMSRGLPSTPHVTPPPHNPPPHNSHPQNRTVLPPGADAAAHPSLSRPPPPPPAAIDADAPPPPPAEGSPMAGARSAGRRDSPGMAAPPRPAAAETAGPPPPAGERSFIHAGRVRAAPRPRPAMAGAALQLPLQPAASHAAAALTR